MNDLDYGFYIFEMLCVDLIYDCLLVLVEIYCMMCLGELLIKEVVEGLFDNMFFLIECYDLLVVGCMKFNCLLGIVKGEDLGVLSNDDIIGVMRKFIEICNGCGEVDDIDYLGNCCICSVGEMVEN